MDVLFLLRASYTRLESLKVVNFRGSIISTVPEVCSACVNIWPQI